MKRQRLNASGTVMDVVQQLSENNPGAFTILINLLQRDKTFGFMLLLDLDDMNMRGEQVVVAFKDHCKEDMAVFIAAIADRDEAMLATVNRAFATPGAQRAIKHGASFQHDDRGARSWPR